MAYGLNFDDTTGAYKLIDCLRNHIRHVKKLKRDVSFARNLFKFLFKHYVFVNDKNWICTYEKASTVEKIKKNNKHRIDRKKTYTIICW